MNVLLLSTSDIAGGAARASYRLHQGLQGIGVASQILVQEKSSDDKTVIAPRTRLAESIARTRVAVDALPLKLYSQRKKTTFSLQWFPDKTVSKIAELDPDVINLHWFNEAFIRVETISKFNKPLVWTLHDMWAFTGGCHYSGDCNRYTTSCGTCPQLHSNTTWDLTRWLWRRKVNAWKKLHPIIITASTWMADCAKASSLFKDFRIEVIPYSLDTKVYKPIDQRVARDIFKLPQDKKIILFGAISPTTDPRKGFHLLQLALQNLEESTLREKFELVVFGTSEIKNRISLKFNIHCIGKLKDDISLAILYSAADVMLVPSIQEGFGQTALESLACGTPVVCFDSTGLKDIVDHQKTGYRAECFSYQDLANGINWTLENEERHQKLCMFAREKAENNFALHIQAHRYLSVYEEAVNRFHFSR